MAKYKLLLPKMGESVAEATIIKWNKNIGDNIDIDEAILDIATDKVDSEVPSPVKGKLILKLGDENEVIQVGAVIAIIETGEPGEDDNDDAQPATTQQNEGPQTDATPVVTPAPQPITIDDEVEHEEEILSAPSAGQPVPGTELLNNAPPAQSVSQPDAGRFYSPLVKNIAAQEGVSQQEMDAIPGSGADGRLTKDDLLQYIQNRSAAPKPQSRPSDALTQPVSKPDTEPQTVIPQAEVPKMEAAIQQPAVETPKPQQAAPATEAPKAEAPKPQPAQQPKITSMTGGDEIIEMDRMRRLIAEHMVMSVHTSPHVTSFIEVDVTNIVLWREKNKDAFEKREGTKITYTPIFIEAVAKAIRDMPMINVSVKGTQIIKKKDINIGMATALPSGNLIVPVIRRADELNVVGLTKVVNDLANRARTNKLLPDDVKEGTFTITNVGTFGNVMGTPIINQPQVAILAIGAIKKKPAVIETPSGDVIAIRHLMFLSLSYDHRVVDGSLGGSFIRRVADYLEGWEINREI